uniref:Uncharacterized protein n=1 Tax=Marmota marmota marmota TaxID=9994 RepID=A0A8C5ZIW0_MARMA
MFSASPAASRRCLPLAIAQTERVPIVGGQVLLPLHQHRAPGRGDQATARGAWTHHLGPRRALARGTQRGPPRARPGWDRLSLRAPQVLLPGKEPCRLHSGGSESGRSVC